MQQQLSHLHAQQARNAANEAARTAARAVEQTAHTKRNAQREAEYAAQCTELEKQAASEALVPQQAETLTEAPTRTQRPAKARPTAPRPPDCRQHLWRKPRRLVATFRRQSAADRGSGPRTVAARLRHSTEGARVVRRTATASKGGRTTAAGKTVGAPKDSDPAAIATARSSGNTGAAGAAGGLAGEASEAPPGVAWRNCRWSVSAVHWIPYIQPAVF